MWPYNLNPMQIAQQALTPLPGPASPMPVAQRAAAYQPPQLTQGAPATMPSLLQAPQQPQQPMPQPAAPMAPAGPAPMATGFGAPPQGSFTPMQPMAAPAAPTLGGMTMPGYMPSGFSQGIASSPSLLPASYSPSSVSAPGSSPGASSTMASGGSAPGGGLGSYFGPTHQMLVESFQQSLGKQNAVQGLLSAMQADPALARQVGGLLASAYSPTQASNFKRLDWNSVTPPPPPAPAPAPQIVYQPQPVFPDWMNSSDNGGTGNSVGGVAGVGSVGSDGNGGTTGTVGNVGGGPGDGTAW